MSSNVFLGINSLGGAINAVLNSSPSSQSDSSASTANLLSGLLGSNGSSGTDSFVSSLSSVLGSNPSSSLTDVLLLAVLMNNGNLSNLFGASSNSNTTTSTDTSTTTSADSSASSTPPVLFANRNVSLIDNYAQNVDQNGVINQDGITKLFKNLNLDDATALKAAKVNIMATFAQEIAAGKRITTSQADENQFSSGESLDPTKAGDHFALVASNYMLNGGTFDDAQLQKLLQDTNNTSLANADGVGTKDVETLHAVETALNQGTLTLDQVLNNDTQNPAIKDQSQFNHSTNYIDNQFQSDFTNLESGVQQQDTSLLSKIEGIDSSNETSPNSDTSSNSLNCSLSTLGSFSQLMKSILPIVLIAAILKKN